MVEPLPFLADLLGEEYGRAITQAIYFVVTFALVYLASRTVVLPLVDRVLTAKTLDKHARRPLKRLVHYVMLFVAVSVAFGLAGFGSFLQSLATIAAAATLAIGLATQDVLKNFVAGLFIYTDRPFRIGDWIEWDDNEGIVDDITLRVTRVVTFDNELLTVPNSQLTDGVIKNPVARERLRLQVPFGIGYDDDIHRATDIIIEEAEAHDSIMDSPAPSVRLAELGDSSVVLKSRVWIDDPSRSDFVKTRGEYVTTVKERFDEEGIDIPYPHRVLMGDVAIDGEVDSVRLAEESAE